MRLVKFQTVDASVYVNPDHVVAVFKGLRDTTIVTAAGNYTVRLTPDEVARMLGAEDIAIDVTPQLTRQPI